MIRYLNHEARYVANSFEDTCAWIRAENYTGQLYSEIKGYALRNCTFEFAIQWKARLDLAGVLDYPEYIKRWTHDETSAPDLPRPSS